MSLTSSLFLFIRSYVRTNLYGVTATYGPLRPSELTSCRSLRRMVRGGRRDGHPGGRCRPEQTCTHVASFPSNSSFVGESVGVGIGGSLQRMVRGGHQNKHPGGHFRERASLFSYLFVRSYVRSNHLRVTPTRGSLRRSEQTSCGSVQRMVRGVHQNERPGGPLRTAQTYTHVMSFASSFASVGERSGERPRSGARINISLS